MTNSSNLIQKYNVPGPRYTSYPTVPYWEEDFFSVEKWKEKLVRSFRESNLQEGISVYIHLPYCDSLCTFCACHKHITRQHGVERPYIEAVLAEWQLYIQLLQQTVHLKELHLGGGTPTFFSPENLQLLITGLLDHAQPDAEAVLSFEGHPNNTTAAHLQTLYDLGFRRVSFGVQDYDLKVQRTINRIQPFEQVQQVTQQARAIGYTSISHDLVFGLPHQSWQSMADTIEKTSLLRPDRLSFYSYAHVPWIKGVGQRGYDEKDLPNPDQKREMYEKGKLMLENAGYVEIGMDHFSLPGDSLYQSMLNRKIHRNFMGYSSSATQVMIGLGMSAISDSWYAFAQNNKSVEGYINQVKQGELAVFRGHILNTEDLLIRRHILNLMCHLETSWNEHGTTPPDVADILDRLAEMEADGLLTMIKNGIRVTEAGRPFVRNIAMAFDVRMLRKQPQTRIFSMTV